MWPSLKVICSAGWSPVGRPVMNGVTSPVSGLTATMRELLLLPLVRRLWLESEANSRPPSKPFSNAPLVGAFTLAGFPRGPAIFVPLWLNTRMSGVNGLRECGNAVWNVISSLQILGRPCPDSSTKTSNFLALPRKATAVGAFSPATKTDTLKPEGTTMSWPLSGLKDTVSAEHSGFATVAAVTRLGRVSSSGSATIRTNRLNRSTLLRMSTPLSSLSVHRMQLLRLAVPSAPRRARASRERRPTRQELTAGGGQRDTPHEFSVLPSLHVEPRPPISAG